MTLDTVKKILALHKNELSERFHVQSIGIFGSYARRSNELRSDIDLLVEFKEPIGWEIVDLHDYLEQLLGLKVDLVTKNAAARKPLLWQSIQEDIVYV